MIVRILACKSDLFPVKDVKYKCKKCKYTWQPKRKVSHIPRECPKCKSRKWS